MNHVNKQLRDFVNIISKDRRVIASFGVFVGALGEMLLIPAFLLLAYFVFRAYKEHLISKEKNDLTQREIKNLLRPDNGAIKAVRKANKNYQVVDKLIEIQPHPNLNNAVSLENAGWNPGDETQLVVEYEDKEFNLNSFRTKMGNKKYDPPNNKKYCLVNVSFVTEESPLLELTIENTSYFNIRRVKDFLKENPAGEQKFLEFLKTIFCIFFNFFKHSFYLRNLRWFKFIAVHSFK